MWPFGIKEVNRNEYHSLDIAGVKKVLPANLILEKKELQLKTENERHMSLEMDGSL